MIKSKKYLIKIFLLFSVCLFLTFPSLAGAASLFSLFSSISSMLSVPQPFGGLTGQPIPCTCTSGYFLIPITPPKSDLPKFIMYNPLKATTYAFGKIPQAGVQVLGTHGADVACKIWVVFSCITVGTGKNVIMVGTSGGSTGGVVIPPTKEEEEKTPVATSTPSTPPDQCKRMGDKAYVYNSRGTGYYPTASATGSAENRMEGGNKDRLGKPLYTLQDFLEGKASYVSVAMDNKAFPYGSELCIPELEQKYNKQIIFKVVDTGGAFNGKSDGIPKGTTRIDVCTRNKKYSVESPPNGTLTLVSKVQSAR